MGQTGIQGSKTTGLARTIRIAHIEIGCTMEGVYDDTVSDLSFRYLCLSYYGQVT